MRKKMEKELTPEERLLRLIRGSKEGKSGPEKAEKASGAREDKGEGDSPGGQPGPRPARERPKSRGPTQRASRKRAGKRKVSRANFINRILLCLLLAILAYLFFEVAIAKPYLARVEIPKVKKALLEGQVQLEEGLVKEAPEEEPLIKLKPLSYYTEQIGKRDLFKPLAVKRPPKKEKAPEVSLEDLAKNLILKGIIAGPQPQAIIEDRKTKRTHFLNRGEKIGQIILEDIQDGKVKLRYQEQEMDLTM